MRLVWTTDLHLNHVRMTAWDRWAEEVLSSNPDAILITGDISEADDVIFQLHRMAESFPVQIFFVLGNHDFYASSIAATRQRVVSAVRDTASLVYLTDCRPVPLGDGSYLVGEDGWGDGTEGDYLNSPVRLNDFRLIAEFQNSDPSDWPSLMKREGAQSADRLSVKLDALPDDAKHILVATHVPPFREACWYEGQTTDDAWAPFFVCGQIGRVLRQFAQRHPERELTVLCGHTHHGGTAQIEPNLRVHTGAAEYGCPRIERVMQC
ncbi:metallophosphoesterase [Roseiconus nitratireducens]|uniref:Metallophosphoesterase n=1 Tax=Roseiconus nitratireducens TaxID=2605748 RepID=A0A5M6DLP6_9BACT|nr:metallophosphoesterase [Roseiconus nitratireducens]KAA5547050.1 metallophosphoesterase [Roseiconus nitratireducens]